MFTKLSLCKWSGWYVFLNMKIKVQFHSQHLRVVPCLMHGQIRNLPLKLWNFIKLVLVILFTTVSNVQTVILDPDCEHKVKTLAGPSYTGRIINKPFSFVSERLSADEAEFSLRT